MRYPVYRAYSVVLPIAEFFTVWTEEQVMQDMLLLGEAMHQEVGDDLLGFRLDINTREIVVTYKKREWADAIARTWDALVEGRLSHPLHPPQDCTLPRSPQHLNSKQRKPQQDAHLSKRCKGV